MLRKFYLGQGRVIDGAMTMALAACADHRLNICIALRKLCQFAMIEPVPVARSAALNAHTVNRDGDQFRIGIYRTAHGAYFLLSTCNRRRSLLNSGQSNACLTLIF